MSLQLLHQGLVEDGFYVGTIQQFQSDFSGKERQQELYSGIVNDGDYDGSFVDFQNKFFPTQSAVTTPTSTTTKPYVAPVVTPEEDLKIEQGFVNKIFWDELGDKYKREDFSKNEDGKWIYTSDGRDVVMEDSIKLLNSPGVKSPQGDAVAQLFGTAIDELNDEEIRIGESTAGKGTTYKDIEDVSKYTEVEVPDDAVVETGFAYWTNSKGNEVSAMQHSDGKWYLNNEESAIIYDKRIEERKEDGIISLEEQAEILGPGWVVEYYEQFSNNPDYKGSLIYKQDGKMNELIPSSKYNANKDNSGLDKDAKVIEYKDHPAWDIYLSREKYLSRKQAPKFRSDGSIINPDNTGVINNYFIQDLGLGGSALMKLIYQPAGPTLKDAAGRNVYQPEKWVAVDVEDYFGLNSEEFKEGRGYFDGRKNDAEMKQKIQNRIKAGMTIGSNEHKLLLKNPEAFFRAEEGKGNYKVDTEGVDHVMLGLEDKVVSKDVVGEYRDEFIINPEGELVEGWGWDVATAVSTFSPFGTIAYFLNLRSDPLYTEEEINLKYEDRATGKRYRKKAIEGDPTNFEKIWDDWEPGTDKVIKDKWEEYLIKKKEWVLGLEDWEELNQDELFEAWKDSEIYKKDGYGESMEKMYVDRHTTNQYESQREFAEFNNISIDKDYENKVKELDKKAQEYFDENTSDIAEEIQGEVQGEISQRFQKNAKGEVIDRSTGEVVSEDFVNDLFKKTIQDRFSKDPDVIRVKRENQALYTNAVKEFGEKWKPSYNLIGRDVLDKMGAYYSQYIAYEENVRDHWDPDVDQGKGLFGHTGDWVKGGKIVSPQEKKAVINGMWRNYVKKLQDEYSGEVHELADYLDQRKHEFFTYMYDEAGFGLQFDETGGLSDVMQLTLAQSIVDNQTAIIEKLEAEGGIGYSKLNDISKVIKLSEDILDQTKLTAEDVDSFKEGFTSLETHQYIPFLSGIVDLADSADMYALSKKLESGEELSPQETDLLILHQLKNSQDQRIRDMSSSWYGGGKMTAEMLPYVAEFIVTSGAFTAARVGTQKLIVKGILKRAKKEIDDAAIDYYLKNTGINNARKFQSWLVGTIAQTGANPQRYMTETIKNMTPEMQLMMSEEGDELVAAITGEGMGFAEAFSRGFGVTWAEFATERLGETIPMFGKYLKGKLPEGGQEFMERYCISRYMKKYGLTKTETLRKFTTDKMGWNGFIGEMFEEIVNQPLSNIIMGVGTPGFTADDVFEGMDQRFYEELSISMGTTQLAFGGLSMLSGRHRNKGGYSIEENGHTLTYTKEKFYERYEELKKEGKLNNPSYKINIDINNDVGTFKEIEEELKKYETTKGKYIGVGTELKKDSKEGKEAEGLLNEIEQLTESINNFKGKKSTKKYRDLKLKRKELNRQRRSIFKGEGLVEPESKSNNKVNFVQKNWFDLGLASEIEITGEQGAISGNQNEFKKLQTITEAINEKSQEREDILKSDMSGKEKNQALKRNQKDLKNLEQSKMDIINPYLKRIEKRKRFSAYKKVTTTIEELAEKMKIDTRIVERNTLQQTKKVILEDVKRQLLETKYGGQWRQISQREGMGDLWVTEREGKTFTEKQYIDNPLWALSLTEKEKQTVAELEGDLYGEEVMGVDPKTKKPSKNPAHGYIPSFKSQLDENPHGMLSKDGKFIFINKSSALAKKGGNINVAAHEFLHVALKTMLDQNPHTQMALGKALHRHVMAIDPRGYSGEFNQRLQAYQEGSVQVEMTKLEQSHMMLQQLPPSKENRAELKKIEDRYMDLMNDFTGNMGEEALTLLSDAMMLGNVNMSNQNLSLLGRIIERILGAIGLRATFKTGEDVYDFIAGFSDSIQKGKVSKKLRKQLSQKAELKGELKEDQIRESQERNIKKTSSNQFSKSIDKTEQELGRAANTPAILKKNDDLQQEILDRYENEETTRDKNGKIIVPQDIRDQLVDNNMPRVTALAAQAANAGKNIQLEQNKKKGFDQFYPEYYMKLDEMTGTYNAEMVPFGAYMNSFLPLKYSGILEDLKKGEIQNAVSEEEAKNIAAEKEKKKEELGKLIKLYERFGDYAEMYNIKVKKAIEEGKFNPAQENISRIGINTIDLFPQSTQLMFGVIPKEGNLTKGDVKEAQMFINNHVETIESILPKYDKVVVKINKKTGKPSVIKSIGLPHKLRKLFYTKSDKRIGNDYIWTRNEVINTNKLLKHVGITERTKPNLYKKGDNTSQSVIGLMNLVGRMMTNQASREYFLENNMPLENMGMLQESMGSNLFSKKVNEASEGNKAILFAALPRIGEHYKKHGNNIRKSFNTILPDWWEEGREEVIKELEEYIETYSEYVEEATLGQQPVLTLENYITEKTMMLTLEKNLSETTGVDIKKAFSNKDALISARSAIATIVEEGGVTIEEVNRFLAFLGGSGNIGNTTLTPNSQGDLVKNTKHWQSKMKKAQKELNTAKAKKNQKKIKELEARIAKYKKNIAEDVIVEAQRYGLFKGVEDLRTVVTKNNEKLVKGLKPLLKIGSTITKKAGEDALLDLADKLDNLDNERADGLVSWLDSAIELMENGYPGDATKKLKQFNQACKDALSGENVSSAVETTKVKIAPNTQQNVNVSLKNKEDNQAQEDSSMRNKVFLKKFGKALRELKKQGKISKTDQAMILMVFGNGGMKTPIAAAAKVAYTTDISGKSISSATHRYEHLIPRKLITLYFANSIIDGSAQSQLEFDNILDQSVVAIIPKEQDKIINNVGYQSAMPNSWFIGANALQRYFNMRTFGKINLKLIDVKTGKPITGYENFNKVHEINGDNHAKQVILNKAMLAGRVVTPARGMSTFDFDETVGISDNYVIATREGETQKIPSEQWPFVGEQMKNEGWVMDFTDFNQVTEGKPGPLMQKLKNQIKKYGNENVFILTARAAESAPAIKAYLESEGVDLPIENITGLGNSTGAAKAEWMLEKFSEGYNDMYFVDDALPNVEAVKNVLDQLDIKSNVQIARQNFSKSIKREFAGIMDNASLDMNRILEQTKGVKAEAVFSAAQAKVRGGKIGRYKIFLPPSAQDFKGLLYHFLGKGRVGEAQMAFFDKALIKPFARAISEINSFKQVLNNKYKTALKEFGVNTGGYSLSNTVGETNFTEEQAIRVYLWNKAGFEIPGLSKRDLKTLVDFVEANQNLQAFAETIGAASEQEAGYLEPSDYWMVENLQSDILKIANERKRSDFLAEWKQNVEIIFSPANLNKIEAIYGSNFREALEDMLHRMEHGTSRESGKSRIVNQFNNWANQSVGAIMFFNMRSALLQTISSVNFINWSDNNPLNAAIAFGNQPQFWKDFAMIFNSDMLKQRRSGNQRGINESELADAVAGSTNKARAALNWLLTKGFLPTQIADSFAIASGGATFYRNRLNTYLKQGYSQEEAHKMAFQDFQENSEESQQSSRPDMISQQQASPLGRYILAFKNTPMQYARLIQKAMSDLKNGRGDAKTNMSKIVYYAMVQNFIFSALQTSLGMMIGTDDEEEEDTNKYERLVNSMIDSLLGGLGIGGVAVSTLKNTIQEWLKQDAKVWNADHAYTLLRFFGLSPTIGSKGRKLYSAIQTWKFNEDVIKEMSLLNIDNPIYSIVGNLVSAIANVPLDRVVKKIDNIDAAITEDLSALQRLALLMGWNTWDIDVEDSDVLAVEDEIKEKKDIENKKKKKKKKEEKKKEKEEEEKIVEEGFVEDQKQEIKDGKKDITCVAVSKSGSRCKTKVEGGNKYCTIHESVEQGTKEVQCKKIKSNKKRCGMMTKAKSGYCYYHD